MKVFSYFACQIIVICLFLPNTVWSQWIQEGSKVIPNSYIGSTVWFGYSVALSADGNTAIVGGIGDNANAGAAWVYKRDIGGNWIFEAKLIGSGAVGNASQGFAVALSSDGNTALVGGLGDDTNKGAVWVFTRSGSIWSQQGNKLVGSGAIGNAQQGSALSLSADGNMAIIGGFRDNNFAGAIWVFTRTGNVWSQQGSKITVSDAIGNARFGISVDLSSDGSTAIVGGHTDNTNAGAAWILTRTGTTWLVQTKLTGAGAVGTARFGRSVSISSDGNTAIVGGYEDNASTGAVWVFTGNGSTWTQQGNKLVGSGATGNASQGFSISLSSDGNTALVGGIDDNATAGAAWVFIRNGVVWSQSGNKLVGSSAIGSANQGGAVAISYDGNTAIIGGIADNINLGAAWVFIPGTTSIPVDETLSGFLLEQNYPNPFNPSTVIRYQLPVTGFVTLKVYDVLGNEVATLVNEEKPAGSYEVEFSVGQSATGGSSPDIASGIYFYKLQAGSFVETKKMLLLK
ncbi:MAG: T9SS type A sorting domain-containing protein [Ignavibacteriota bacterium]|jgi:hypothetical protein|nr:T9SS type A sorting domain-containing protein [Ignavibacteriales bacterium]MBL1122104.1 T9SS C-terminal target domain-containing protein [Ignavibacteriota bacterium]MCE7856735.1 T9SS C-terminal target domain-containing protein [Ignavibacteria bacterium CHB3]MCZ7614164.1 T9SS type A sorting domain-containing protein [Ignavibacteriaceae bacterium]MEB2296409.1 T9SS type A sorting domain-containing protein [Ignavibacteria bacterium]